MGIIGKLIVGTGVAVASLAGVTSLLNSPKKRLQELDEEFEQKNNAYQAKRKALLKKVDKGDWIAAKKLKELDESFNVQKEEYEKKRKEIESKIKKSKKEIEVELQKEENERAHQREMEKLEAVHAMEMEKLSYQKENSKNNAVTLQNKEIEMVVCVSCGAQNNWGAKFCSSCGKAIEQKKFCTNCGHQLSGDSKFCTECGEKV